MSKFQLSSKRDAEESLAELISCSSVGHGRPCFTLEVKEDKCFNDNWANVGKIELHPEQTPNAEMEDSARTQRILEAIQHGFFEWSIPKQNDLEKEIESKIGKSNGSSPADQDRIKGVTKAVVHVAIRCGLAHPVFDAPMLSHMQSHRPISVVVDTSAVIQGGLDFFARHVTPQARIKVPALVHMEILNLSDRYFKQRRAKKYSPKMMLDHVNSQGGQRVLLRLETDEDVEFERPRLGSDPLRGVISPDSDAEDKSLGLQHIQKSFADRLILETAVQHRDQVGPAHPVMLLTSDQGLARMAVAENIQPIYFSSSAISHLFGTKLSGIAFMPFSNVGKKFFFVGLVKVLWEFAATFGASRLRSDVNGCEFEVVALGSVVAWQPFHSYEDLLWIRMIKKEGANSNVGEETKSMQATPLKRSISSTGSQSSDAVVRRSVKSSKRKGTYSFSLDSMLRLLAEVNESEQVPDDRAMSVTKVKSKSSYSGYYNFLVAGEFVNHENGMLYKSERFDELYAAFQEKQYSSISNLLGRVGSFATFLQRLSAGTALKLEASKMRKDSFRCYSKLAEICCSGVRFTDQGIFGTPNDPGPSEFAQLAVDEYESVRAGDTFALTGKWLENLAKHHGIHPVRAKQRLAESHQGGYVQRFFEGSTPDTRFENRTIQVLEVDQRCPIIRTFNLYHGDFLMSGRASVGIKLSIVNGS